MRLVTVTGADDAVDPKALYSLSCEFPFVEWGILFSDSREATPRYPSAKWVYDFCDCAGIRPAIHASAHLCGSRAREYVRRPFGGGGPLRDIGRPPFRRVQFNGHEPSRRHFIDLPIRNDFQWILQCRSHDTLRDVVADARDVRASVLFDPSGGRGIATGRWPKLRKLGVPLGYAGGITQDNVRDVLREIGPCGPDAWIDMESGVRTGDAFDVAKVRAVLEAVAGSGWTS